MNEQPPRGDEFDDVDDLYRRASALDTSRPSEAVRRDVLAHAARLADERASSRGGHKGVASRIGWRPAVFGTLAAAALAGLMVVPRFLAPLAPAPMSAGSPGAPSPMTAPASPGAPSRIAAPFAPTAPTPAPTAPTPAMSGPTAKRAAGPPAALLPTPASPATASGESSSPAAGYARDATSGPTDAPVPAQAAAPPQERAPALSGGFAQSPELARRQPPPSRDAAPLPRPTGGQGASSPDLASSQQPPLSRGAAPSPEPTGGQGASSSSDLAQSQQPSPQEQKSALAPSAFGGNIEAQSSSSLASSASSASSTASASAARVAPGPGKSTTLAEVTVTGARRTAQDQALAEAVVVGPSASDVRSAAEAGDLPALRKLLDMPVNLDSRDSLGRTALMLATLGGHAEAVDLLLEHGADPNVADDHGVTPLQVAKNDKKTAIAAALQRKGAR